MAPSSPTFLNHLSLSRKGPLLPVHGSTRWDGSNYDLDELEPRPTDGLLASHPPELIHRRKPRRGSGGRIPEPSISDADNEEPPLHQPSSSVLFDGPPPPIARSALLTKNDANETSPPGKRNRQQSSHQNIASSLMNIGSVFFDNHRNRQQAQHQPAPDSIWQNLRRREKAMEDDLQQVLDMQAAALAGELGRASPRTAGEEFDGHSDTGSSTPTATFYSTASSKSKMMRSLNLPTRSTPSGNVIPVRQPTKSRRPPGIRTARHSLLRSMAALADFKAEEDACISSAISQRKMALARLRKLAASQQALHSELQALDEDEEEPLGKELKDLQSERVALTDEIKQLEERLVGLRNKRRWVDRRIEDVGNRREAGLSGYKGALKEVEADIDAFVRRPSIKPLDRGLWASQKDGSEPSDTAETSPGGEEFLRLIPERRTLDMARAWWETEILVLENRRNAVDRDREALESGERLWGEVIDLVTDYETGIVDLMKGGRSTRKGKEKVPSADDITGQLLEKMRTVISALEEKLKVSEENEWNLLVCAIGAELDAFEEAERVLRRGLSPASNASTVPQEAEEDRDVDAQSSATESPVFKPSLSRGNSAHEGESDSEVPKDLLGSHLEAEPEEEEPRAASPGRNMSSSRGLERRDSENSVPPEFLAEHSDVTD